MNRLSLLGLSLLSSFSCSQPKELTNKLHVSQDSINLLQSRILLLDDLYSAATPTDQYIRHLYKVRQEHLFPQALGLLENLHKHDSAEQQQTYRSIRKNIDDLYKDF